MRPAKRCAGRAGEDDLVAEERLEDDRALAARRADDAELELAVGDPLDDVLGVGDRERDADARGCGAGTRRGAAARPCRRARSRRRSRAGRASSPSPSPADAPRRAAPRARAAAARRGRGACPASVGSTRRPERSSSCWPSRCSSERTCRLTAGCVTPSRSAACEKLLPLDDGAEGGELPRVHKRSLCVWTSDVAISRALPSQTRDTFADTIDFGWWSRGGPDAGGSIGGRRL